MAEQEQTNYRQQLKDLDAETADELYEIRRKLELRQLPYGSLVMSDPDRTEATKHLKIAEMYLRAAPELT